jgi:hypothetical protein
MSDEKPPLDSPLGPREALVHIRKLIGVASKSDDLETVKKLLKEMRALVDKAIPPHRRK